ncbi:hypothetical protein [Candidatus Entotheonella palauensis]|uniref:Uncharacterized protein n=1 Tax=Candidatus Entotheonella gemina TaxID=1429439 RepID=W4M5V4_9BACT|nr:hypothetical protein [Candidatus Entotheonella palauensis]ETX05563.1 MAG: hypothetical protein ETSY2_22200 [Candidatus Entotheonella gemina]
MMSKTYEAIYEDGHLEWLGEQPGTGRHRLLVTVVEKSPPKRSPQEVHRMFEATRGAWGRGKTLDDIDAEIDLMRAEWDRDEHGQ